MRSCLARHVFTVLLVAAAAVAFAPAAAEAKACPHVTVGNGFVREVHVYRTTCESAKTVAGPIYRAVVRHELRRRIGAWTCSYRWTGLGPWETESALHAKCHRQRRVVTLIAAP